MLAGLDARAHTHTHTAAEVIELGDWTNDRWKIISTLSEKSVGLSVAILRDPSPMILQDLMDEVDVGAYAVHMLLGLPEKRYFDTFVAASFVAGAIGTALPGGSADE